MSIFLPPVDVNINEYNEKGLISNKNNIFDPTKLWQFPIQM